MKGLLFLSSGDVYGKVTGVENIYESTLGEIDPLDIHSCYSESKRMAETLLSSFHREYGLNTLIARVGHTYGPTMDVENDPRSFASFMKCALNDENIILHSDGLAKRPFCYISDAVAGYFLIILKGNGGEAYNVTNTEQFIPIRYIAKIAADLPCKGLKVSYKERNKSDTYHQDTINIENKPVEDKLIKLGWTHKVSVSEGFSRVYRYFNERKA